MWVWISIVLSKRSFSKGDGFFYSLMLYFLIKKYNRILKIEISHPFFIILRFLKIWNVTYMIFSDFFMSLSVFHDLKKSQLSHGKLKIWKKNRKFWQNYQKPTNVGFCDNSFNRSLDLILKYIVCNFHGCTTVLRKWGYFEFKKNKLQDRAKNWQFLAVFPYILQFFFKFKISSFFLKNSAQPVR